MKQISYFIAALVFLAFAGCTSTPKADQDAEAGAADAKATDNVLTEKEKQEGWILLFDGETTDGWRGYGMETFPDTGWSIENGTLKCSNSGQGEAGFGGDIIYDKKFSNFHLKVDWMIEEGGNSGIFFLGREMDDPDKKIWYTAPEMQILDNYSSHIDNMLGVDGNRRAGSLYDLIPSDTALFRGPMEWHTAEIISYEGTVAFKMNGKTTLEIHLWTPEWEEMIANSKFVDFNPDFADVAKEGYIALQDHGHAVWFKNIKLREL